VKQSDSFNCRGNAYGGRYKSIGDQRSTPDNGRIDNPLRFVAPHQCIQREYSALTFVIGIKSEIHILNGGDQGQCPKHARQTTKNKIFRYPMLSDNKAKGIDGRGSDVTIYYPK
jgi:hypothetical protein